MAMQLEAKQPFDFDKTLTEADIAMLLDTLLDTTVDIAYRTLLLEAFSKRDMQPMELTHFVRQMIQTTYAEQPYMKEAMCVCGTGGDRSGSFNISTTVSFIVASAGVPVIKHGNKSITSKSGSVDVLKVIGIEKLNMANVDQGVSTYNLAFLSATETYPIMRHIQPLRKAITMPTIFNIIGPLIHPYMLDYQVMGVYKPDDMKHIASTLRDLGRKRAIVLHGANGMDEATLSGDNVIYEINGNAPIKPYTLRAEDVGLTPADNATLKGGKPEENAETMMKILAGHICDSRRDVVVLNAGIALYVAQRVKTIEAGVRYAEQLIDSGMANHTFNEMRG